MPFCPSRACSFAYHISSHFCPCVPTSLPCAHLLLLRIAGSAINSRGNYSVRARSLGVDPVTDPISAAVRLLSEASVWRSAFGGAYDNGDAVGWGGVLRRGVAWYCMTRCSVVRCGLVR